MAKAWYEFANWSLEMGEKVLASAINGRIPLNQTELSNLADTTEHQLNEENMQVILDITLGEVASIYVCYIFISSMIFHLPLYPPF